MSIQFADDIFAGAMAAMTQPIIDAFIGGQISEPLMSEALDTIYIAAGEAAFRQFPAESVAGALQKMRDRVTALIADRQLARMPAEGSA